MLLACLVLGMLACHADALELRTERAPLADVAGGPVVLVRASCTLTFTDGNGNIDCGPGGPHPRGVHSAGAALSPFGPYVSFNPTTLVKDTVRQTWSFNGTVQNLMAEPLGTLNGTTVLGVYGVVEGIQVTSGAGTVTVANADGNSVFTAPKQPYFRYAEILAPNQASAVKTWRFRVPNAATSVITHLAIVADFPAELNVTATPPDSEPGWFHDDSSWAGPTHQGELKGVVSLCFKDSTTLQDRQLAVGFAGGTIVGGEPVDGGDGCYYMKVPNNGSDPMDTAINRLQSLPRVEVAAHTDQASPAQPHVRLDAGSAVRAKGPPRVTNACAPEARNPLTWVFARARLRTGSAS